MTVTMNPFVLLAFFTILVLGNQNTKYIFCIKKYTLKQNKIHISRPNLILFDGIY